RNRRSYSCRNVSANLACPWHLGSIRGRMSGQLHVRLWWRNARRACEQAVSAFSPNLQSFEDDETMSRMRKPAGLGRACLSSRACHRLWGALVCSLFVLCCSRTVIAAGDPKSEGPEIRVSFGPELSKTPLDGRLLVMLSTDPKDEPRFQISDSTKTQQIF